MTIRNRHKLGELHPVWAAQVTERLAALERHGINGTLFTVWRSDAEQERRYKLGESSARAGQSPHNVTYRRRPAALAIDFVPDQGEDSAMQSALQDWWAAQGFAVIRTGVGPDKRPDRSHVEFPSWREVVRAYGS